MSTSTPCPLKSSVRAAVASLSILACALIAPDAAASFAPQSGHESWVRFSNRTEFQRREWGTATVPFPRGAFTPGRNFVVEGLPSELEPFGARWPDGSVRFARLSVRLDLAPHRDVWVKVKEAPRNTSPFVSSPWLRSCLKRFDMAVVAGTTAGPRWARLKLHQVVERTDARITVWYQDRIPETDLVYDIWITFLSDQDTARFEMRVTNGSTTSPNLSQDIQYLLLFSGAAEPMLQGMTRENMQKFLPPFQGSNAVRLLGATNFYDGQAKDWWGDLAFFDPAITLPDQTQRVKNILGAFSQPLYGVATNWAESGAFGPFGHVSATPPWIKDGGVAAAALTHGEFMKWYLQPGVDWEDRPKALVKGPGTAGSQHDFGAAKFIDIFATAIPDGIVETRYTAGEEAQRPVHFREPDGSPLQSARHPNWVAWDGRTHFNKGISPDRLGKVWPEPYINGRSHDWSGKDNQHWSSLCLASAYLLTTSYSLQMELDNEAELYLASHTIASQKPGWSTNGAGTARAIGRTFYSLSWNYLCTNRSDLAARMVARVDESVLASYKQRNVPGPVRPMAINSPDPRTITWTNYWSPWEEAQAVMGLEACYRVTGSLNAHLLAALAAKNLYTYGWRITPQEVSVAFAVAWNNDGSPLTKAQYDDPYYVKWPSSSFNIWSLPATKLALSYGLMYGDNDLALRAGTVLAWDIARRTAPHDFTWDEFSAWDAVK
jgi:hypothetical protein